MVRRLAMRSTSEIGCMGGPPDERQILVKTNRKPHPYCSQPHHAQSSTKQRAAVTLAVTIKTWRKRSNMGRRQLALPALEVGLLGIDSSLQRSCFCRRRRRCGREECRGVPQGAARADAEALGSLCAAELSYSHSDGRVKQGYLHRQRHQRKIEVLSLEYQDGKLPWSVPRRSCVPLAGRIRTVADSKKSSTNLHILMNWQKQGADWKLLSRGSTKL